jgi:hypothetical protein
MYADSLYELFIYSLISRYRFISIHVDSSLSSLYKSFPNLYRLLMLRDWSLIRDGIFVISIGEKLNVLTLQPMTSEIMRPSLIL